MQYGKIRIDKYLADAGFGSRKDVKGLLKAKQVTINGETCVHAEEKLEPAQDVVCVQDKMVVYESFSYYMLHKPQGVVSATKDAHEKTVVNLITEQKRRDLFPVGRLDKDTEGLLLLTNDGKLSMICWHRESMWKNLLCKDQRHGHEEGGRCFC